MSSIDEALDAVLESDRWVRDEIEIGDKVFKVKSLPLTGADLDWVQKKHKRFATEPSIEATVDLMIRKIKNDDAEGRPAFTMATKPRLLKMDIGWISDVREKFFSDVDQDMSDERMEEEVGN